jgi:hypothetical protein
MRKKIKLKNKIKPIKIEPNCDLGIVSHGLLLDEVGFLFICCGPWKPATQNAIIKCFGEQLNI